MILNSIGLRVYNLFQAFSWGNTCKWYWNVVDECMTVKYQVKFLTNAILCVCDIWKLNLVETLWQFSGYFMSVLGSEWSCWCIQLYDRTYDWRSLPSFNFQWRSAPCIAGVSGNRIRWKQAIDEASVGSKVADWGNFFSTTFLLEQNYPPFCVHLRIYL